MSESEFNRLYMTEPVQCLDWPEVFKEKSYSGIYFGKCGVCGFQFAGYKRRSKCYPCHQANPPKGD